MKWTFQSTFLILSSCVYLLWICGILPLEFYSLSLPLPLELVAADICPFLTAKLYHPFSQYKLLSLSLSILFGYNGVNLIGVY